MKEMMKSKFEEARNSLVEKAKEVGRVIWLNYSFSYRIEQGRCWSHFIDSEKAIICFDQDQNIFTT